ncbi:MAG: hypothetical protein GY711_32595 [bacterium]|nr:hypothetical protein [bacterium]
MDVYVLGAGASYVHGAPLTDGILPYALTVGETSDDARMELIREFLLEAFHFRAPKGRAAQGWSSVPSLVDVLSIVDLALDHKESLTPGFSVEWLREVRRALEFAIFIALNDSLRGYNSDRGRHSHATWELAKRMDLRSSGVISFNYDVIVDSALANRGKGSFRGDLEALAEGDHGVIDYGVEFSNVERVPIVRERIPLLKLHGSFNWLRSRVTGNLYYGGMRKAVGLAFDTDKDRAAADLWKFFAHRGRRMTESVADLEPVVVTPTHLKDLRNPHLARVWRRAEELLRCARSITFIGYSLPGDDLHVKYLLKRGIEARIDGARSPRITVVDKGNPRTSQVKRNYETFFGKGRVKYYGKGFDRWLAETKPKPKPKKTAARGNSRQRRR